MGGKPYCTEFLITLNCGEVMSIGFSPLLIRGRGERVQTRKKRDSSVAGRCSPYGDCQVVKAEPRLWRCRWGAWGGQGQQVRAFRTESLEEAERSPASVGAFVWASPPLFCPRGAVSHPSLRADAVLADTCSWSGWLVGLAMCVQTQTTQSLCVSWWSCFLNSITDYSPLTRNLVAAGLVS